MDAVLEMKAEPFPTLTSVNENIIYAAVPAQDMIYVIGPVGFQTQVNINRNIQAVDIDSNWIQSLSICDFDDFLRDILLIYNLFHDEMLTAGDIIKENCVDSLTKAQIQKNFSELIFENHENGKKHNPYDQEVREFSSIENGDIQQLEQSWAEDYTDSWESWQKTGFAALKTSVLWLLHWQAGLPYGSFKPRNFIFPQ